MGRDQHNPRLALPIAIEFTLPLNFRTVRRVIGKEDSDRWTEMKALHH